MITIRADLEEALAGFKWEVELLSDKEHFTTPAVAQHVVVVKTEDIVVGDFSLACG